MQLVPQGGAAAPVNPQQQAATVAQLMVQMRTLQLELARAATSEQLQAVGQEFIAAATDKKKQQRRQPRPPLPAPAPLPPPLPRPRHNIATEAPAAVLPPIQPPRRVTADDAAKLLRVMLTRPGRSERVPLAELLNFSVDDAMRIINQHVEDASGVLPEAPYFTIAMSVEQSNKSIFAALIAALAGMARLPSIIIVIEKRDNAKGVDAKMQAINDDLIASALADFAPHLSSLHSSMFLNGTQQLWEKLNADTPAGAALRHAFRAGNLTLVLPAYKGATDKLLRFLRELLPPAARAVVIVDEADKFVSHLKASKRSATELNLLRLLHDHASARVMLSATHLNTIHYAIRESLTFDTVVADRRRLDAGGYASEAHLQPLHGLFLSTPTTALHEFGFLDPLIQQIVSDVDSTDWPSPDRPLPRAAAAAPAKTAKTALLAASTSGAKVAPPPPPLPADAVAHGVIPHRARGKLVLVALSHRVTNIAGKPVQTQDDLARSLLERFYRPQLLPPTAAGAPPSPPPRRAVCLTLDGKGIHLYKWLNGVINVRRLRDEAVHGFIAKVRTIGDAINFIDISPELGLDMPIYLFAYNFALRSASLRSPRRVITHMIIAMRPGRSTADVRQLFMRYAGETVDVRRTNVGTAVTKVVCERADYEMSMALYKMTEYVLDRFQRDPTFVWTKDAYPPEFRAVLEAKRPHAPKGMRLSLSAAALASRRAGRAGGGAAGGVLEGVREDAGLGGLVGLERDIVGPAALLLAPLVALGIGEKKWKRALYFWWLAARGDGLVDYAEGQPIDESLVPLSAILKQAGAVELSASASWHSVFNPQQEGFRKLVKVEVMGGGPAYRLTERGQEVLAELRQATKGKHPAR